MTRPHDMGGRTGDGPVIPCADGMAAYDAPWHRAALGLTLAAGGLGAWTIDESRHAREVLPDYASRGYYDKWTAALADLLVAKGLLNQDELAGGVPDRAALSPKALRREDVAGVLARGSPYLRAGPTPIFHPGDRVRSRAIPDNAFIAGGHTRLPAYVAGKTGQIILSHGPHVFADRNAHGLGESPEPLYTVLFLTRDLWQSAENPDDEITVDLWQSYLTAA